MMLLLFFLSSLDHGHSDHCPHDYRETFMHTKANQTSDVGRWHAAAAEAAGQGQAGVSSSKKEKQ